MCNHFFFSSRGDWINCDLIYTNKYLKSLSDRLGLRFSNPWLLASLTLSKIVFYNCRFFYIFTRSLTPIMNPKPTTKQRLIKTIRICFFLYLIRALFHWVMTCSLSLACVRTVCVCVSVCSPCKTDRRLGFFSSPKHINVLDWILSFNTTDASLKGWLYWGRTWPCYSPSPTSPLNPAFTDIKNRTNLDRGQKAKHR